jgi:PAS domain S-box-containing protein
MSAILYYLLKHYVTTIRHYEQNFQTLADSGQALVWLSGTDKLCNYFNKTWLEFTGRTLEQEMGNGWAAGVHPDDLQRCLDIYISSFDRREKFSMDYRLRRHDGEYRWLQDDGSPRYDSTGEFIGYIGFCLDVTEGKQLELELARNNEFMSAILDCLSDGVVVCDKDGRLSLFNRSALEFHGLPQQPLLAEQWAEYYDLFEKDGITRMKTENIPLFRAFQGEIVTKQEIVIVPKGAKPLILLANGRQLLSRSGEKLGAVVSLHDVTMLKTLEEQIRHSQKLDSIGTLAGGVAHDFNNILTVIIGASALLEVDATNDPEQLKLVSQIRSSAERAAKLTQSLLSFSRKQSISKHAEDLGHVVKIMKDFLVRIIGEDILLTTYLPNEPLIVMIDRGQIEQVLMNLAANARDAMQHGGILDVSVSHVNSAGTVLELEGCHSGEYAMITVSDSGEGMDDATRQRIFEPFFTTKMTGKGTGLGLSMAYGIIKQHDGMINVYCEQERGTTFEIYLPLRDQKKKPTSAKLANHLPGGSETILLVEDDPNVLAINRGILERAGYLVLSALDGFEALELFKYGHDKIALVILDVIMPTMNGKDVYEKLKLQKSDVKVLFASGYSADILNRKGIVQESSNFISKPLNPPVFLKRVRTLIDGDPV